MEQSFKKGFYTTSQLERKPEAILRHTSSSNQPFFQKPGLQQNIEEQKQVQKVTHAETPTSEEKPRKQMKSVLHQEVSEFNPSGQMSIEQLIKVVLNLQEEIRKLRKENEKLVGQIQHGIQETLDLRMANQERELDALWNYQREQFNQTNSQVQKIQDQNQQIENILQSQKSLQSQQIPLEQNLNSDKMEIEKTTLTTKKIEQKPQPKKKCYYCKSQYHLWKNCGAFRKTKEQSWKEKVKQQIRKEKNQI